MKTTAEHDALREERNWHAITIANLVVVGIAPTEDLIRKYQDADDAVCDAIGIPRSRR